MGTISNKPFANRTLSLDGVLYEDCTFDNCTFKFSGKGIGPSGFRGSAVMLTPCKFEFVGPAGRAMDLLDKLLVGKMFSLDDVLRHRRNRN